MKINKGEVVQLTARFKTPPAQPVRAWVQPPRAQAADGPIPMTQKDELTFTAGYPAQVTGVHRWLVESSDPVSSEEAVFNVVATTVNKPSN
jgi:hypothetical protein